MEGGVHYNMMQLFEFCVRNSVNSCKFLKIIIGIVSDCAF